MPDQMPMHEAGAGMLAEPAREELVARRSIAGFEIAVCEDVRDVTILPAQRQRTLRLFDADAGITSLDVRPAEIGQEPPVITVVTSHPPADRKPGFVMIVAARESIEPECAEQRHQNQRIARISVDMALRIGECLRRLAFDCRGD